MTILTRKTSPFCFTLSCILLSCTLGTSTTGAVEDTPLDVLIGVMTSHSTPEYKSRERAIADTWGASNSYPGTMVVFVRGIQGHIDTFSSDQFTISSGPVPYSFEAKTSTLVVKITDTYRDLILKVLGLLVWANSSHNFRYIMKVDDDTFVDLSRLSAFLQSLPPSKHYRYYAGRLYVGAPERNPQSKNYLSRTCYPYSFLPMYAWGNGYILSADLVKYIASNHLFLSEGLIHLKDEACGNVEDVQIGLWMFGLGVEPTHIIEVGSALKCHSLSHSLFGAPPEVIRSLYSFQDNTTVGICSLALRNWAEKVFKALAQNAAKNNMIASKFDHTNNQALNQALQGDCTSAEHTFREAIKIASSNEDKAVAEENLNFIMGVSSEGEISSCLEGSKLHFIIQSTIDLAIRTSLQPTARVISSSGDLYL